MTNGNTNNDTNEKTGANIDANKPNVFMVDDDKFLVDMYTLKFQKSGYQVHSSYDPEEALKKFRDGLAPDILLLDVIMPGLTGLELLEAIRKDKLIPNGVIIMLTNQGQAVDMDKARQLDIDGYIIKATTIPSEVVAEVENIYQARKSKSK